VGLFGHIFVGKGTFGILLSVLLQVTLYGGVYQANFILTPAYIWFIWYCNYTVGGMPFKKIWQMHGTGSVLSMRTKNDSPVMRFC